MRPLPRSITAVSDDFEGASWSLSYVPGCAMEPEPTVPDWLTRVICSPLSGSLWIFRPPAAASCQRDQGPRIGRPSAVSPILRRSIRFSGSFSSTLPCRFMRAMRRSALAIFLCRRRISEATRSRIVISHHDREEVGNGIARGIILEDDSRQIRFDMSDGGREKRLANIGHHLRPGNRVIDRALGSIADREKWLQVCRWLGRRWQYTGHVPHRCDLVRQDFEQLLADSEADNLFLDTLGSDNPAFSDDVGRPVNRCRPGTINHGFTTDAAPSEADAWRADHRTGDDLGKIDLAWMGNHANARQEISEARNNCSLDGTEAIIFEQFIKRLRLDHRASAPK
nr:MAG TPA: hypothetical protein [Caudoviricetes sp.]